MARYVMKPSFHPVGMMSNFLIWDWATKELRGKIGGKKFDVVFCSDLAAVDSALLAFEGSATIIQDARLRECNYGTYNGGLSEVVEPLRENITERFPEGESYEDVKSRISDFLNLLKKNYDGKAWRLSKHKAPQLSLMFCHKT